MPATLRQRIQAAGVERRPTGNSVEAGRPIPGVEVFSRTADRFKMFLSALASADWHRMTIRGLDVQQLVGHLIGVEEDFARTLEGFDDTWPAPTTSNPPRTAL